MEIEFTHLTKVSDANTSLDAIHLSLTIEQKQAISSGGIAYDLSLTNRSSDDVSIRNPLDSLQITLQDSEGWPVKLPLGSAPRILVNSSDPPVRPYKVSDFSSTPNDIDLLDKIDDVEFVLESNTTYTFNILIDRVQDVDPKKINATSAQTRSLTTGTYTITMKLPLLLSGHTTAHMLCDSGPIRVELI